MTPLKTTLLTVLVTPLVLLPLAWAVVSGTQQEGVTFRDAWVFLRKHGPSRATDSNADIVADLEAFVPELMAREGVKGAAVALVRGSSVVWARAFGEARQGVPMTLDTPYLAASISKTVSAVGVMRLVQNGTFELDEPVDAQLRSISIDNPYPDAAPVTLRRLLAHTAGFQAGISTTEPLAGRGGLLASTLDANHLRLSYPPGKQNRLYTSLARHESGLYDWIGLSVAGALIEDVTGKSFEENLQTQVFGPLGMASSTYTLTPETHARLAHGELYSLFGSVEPRSPDAATTVLPGGSMVTTLRDFAQFIVLFANRGADANGQRFLEENLVEEMLRPSGRVNLFVENGLGLVVPADPTQRVAAFGGISNIANGFICYPDENLCAVAMTTHRHLSAAFDILYRAVEKRD